MATTPNGSIDSDPLAAVTEMIENRPELTQQEWEIVNKAEPWLRAQVTLEVRRELEVEYAKKSAVQLDELKEANKQYIDEAMAAMRKAQEPLSKDEIQKLLSQEYLDFPVSIRVKKEKIGEGEDPYEVLNFVICEQPSAVEEKFYAKLREAIVPIIQNREAIQFRLDNGTLIDKLQSVLEGSPKLIKLAAELSATCLDPWSRNQKITAEWVGKNVSLTRQCGILIAQFEANKYRDFFSQSFRTFRSLTNNTNQSVN